MQNSRLSHLLLKNSGHFYKIWGILKLVALGPEILCTDWPGFVATVNYSARCTTNPEQIERSGVWASPRIILRICGRKADQITVLQTPPVSRRSFRDRLEWRVQWVQWRDDQQWWEPQPFRVPSDN